MLGGGAGGGGEEKLILVCRQNYLGVMENIRQCGWRDTQVMRNENIIL